MEDRTNNPNYYIGLGYSVPARAKTRRIAGSAERRSKKGGVDINISGGSAQSMVYLHGWRSRIAPQNNLTRNQGALERGEEDCRIGL